MKIQTKEITLHAFSIPGFILPTFQKTTIKIVKLSLFKTVKYVHFKYFEKEGDYIDNLKKTFVKVK